MQSQATVATKNRCSQEIINREGVPLSDVISTVKLTLQGTDINLFNKSGVHILLKNTKTRECPQGKNNVTTKPSTVIQPPINKCYRPI